MKRALIDPRFNRVCQTIDPATEDQFAVATPLFWVNAADDITDRYTYKDGNFTAPVEPKSPTGPDLDAELAAAIESATTLNELKAALLGKLTTGQKGRVAGRPA